MKNYLVKSLFKVKNTNWIFKDRSEEGDLFSLYMRAHEHSVYTFNKFLQGDWELKFFTGEVENISEAYKNTFWYIHDLWHSGPCNIFYTDPDTLAIKKIDPWHYNKFMMFNYTDPVSLIRDDKVIIKDYFNAGVRYFPSTMSQHTWGLGRTLVVNWNFTDYRTEEIILNDMLWSQGLEVKDVLDVSMNWAFFINMNHSTSETFNNSLIDTAKILHFHASRNIGATVKIMDEFVPTLI